MNYLWIGILAGTITCAGFVPQVIKTFRTKKAEDVSLLQPLIISVGIFLWFIYGLLLKDLAIILANIFAFICNLALIAMKIKYTGQK